MQVLVEDPRRAAVVVFEEAPKIALVGDVFATSQGIDLYGFLATVE